MPPRQWTRTTHPGDMSHNRAISSTHRATGCRAGLADCPDEAKASCPTNDKGPDACLTCETKFTSYRTARARSCWGGMPTHGAGHQRAPYCGLPCTATTDEPHQMRQRASPATAPVVHCERQPPWSSNTRSRCRATSARKWPEYRYLSSKLRLAARPNNSDCG